MNNMRNENEKLRPHLPMFRYQKYSPKSDIESENYVLYPLQARTLET